MKAWYTSLGGAIALSFAHLMIERKGVQAANA